MSFGIRSVTRDNPCPVCGHRDWCGTYPGKLGLYIYCERWRPGDPVPAGIQFERTRENGQPRFLCRTAVYPMAVVEAARRCSMDAGPIDYAAWADAQRLAESAMTQTAISRHAARLGVSADSLRALGAGSHGGTLGFPMRDALGRIIGVRLRRDDGTKRAIKGSRNGLFFAPPLRAGTAVIVEGPTSAAAVMDFGMTPIGRPCATAGAAMAADLCRSAGIDGAIVLPDTDRAGESGAAGMISALTRAGVPAYAVRGERPKDARAARLAGWDASRFRDMLGGGAGTAVFVNNLLTLAPALVS